MTTRNGDVRDLDHGVKRGTSVPSHGRSCARLCERFPDTRPRSTTDGCDEGQPTPIFRGRLRSTVFLFSCSAGVRAGPRRHRRQMGAGHLPHRRPSDVVAQDQESGLHADARSARAVRVPPGHGPATPRAATSGSRPALRTTKMPPEPPTLLEATLGLDRPADRFTTRQRCGAATRLDRSARRTAIGARRFRDREPAREIAGFVAGLRPRGRVAAPRAASTGQRKARIY